MSNSHKINFKKNIATLVLSIGIGLFGCSSDNKDYRYEGEYKGDAIKFTKYGDENKLKIEKSSGMVIEYKLSEKLNIYAKSKVFPGQPNNSKSEVGTDDEQYVREILEYISKQKGYSK